MSHDTLRVRLLAFLFLIPLALYAWSAVQAFRVDSTLRDERFMRDWSASARNDPDAAGAIPRHLFRPAYGVEGHLHQFAEDAEAIRRDHPWLALRGWLAAIGKLCALASALVAAALLAKLEYDGRRSMRSQAYLLGHLAPAWRRLGRLVPLHAGLLVAALASQLLYEALWSYSHWHSHGFVALLFSLPLWLLFLGGLLMLRRLRGELLPLEEPVLHLLGRELDRVAAPGLWQWLGQIADRAGAPLPDHVVTGIEHCYFVTQAKILLAPRGIPLEGRTLYIPLTYATVMSEAESAAIIGHELGHFAAGDTAHGASLSLLQRQVRLRIERIAAPEDGRVGLLGKPGLWAALYFLERFERAYLHWNRRQELAADKVGARVAGARVFAIALLRTCALAGLIERLLASPQTRNLVHALTDHLRGNSLELDEQDSARRLEHPFDSHPPTYQRIADLSWRSTTICCDRQGASSAPTTRSGSTACSMQATGKADDPAGRASTLPRRGKGRRSHAVAALRRQRSQPDKHRRRPWRGAAVRPARPAAARRRLDLARPPRSRA